jgi:hypothetical protein
MIAMHRAWIALVSALALVSADGGVARADTAEPGASSQNDPKLATTVQDDHKFSVALQGGLGAAGIAVGLIGASLLVNASDRARAEENAGAGDSCRPCSSGDLGAIRALQYTGYALLGVGGIVVIADIALIAVDATYRGKRKNERRAASLGRSLSLGVRF